MLLPKILNFIFRDSRQLDGLTFQKRFLRNVTGFTEKQTELLFDPTISSQIMKLFQKYLLNNEALEKVLHISQDILQKEIRMLLVPGSTMTDDEDDEDDDDDEPTTNNNNNNSSPSTWITQKLFQFVSTSIFRASVGPLLSMNLIPNHHRIFTRFTEL